MVDAADSKSAGPWVCGSSSLPSGTIIEKTFSPFDSAKAERKGIFYFEVSQIPHYFICIYKIKCNIKFNISNINILVFTYHVIGAIISLLK